MAIPLDAMTGAGNALLRDWFRFEENFP